MMHGAEYMGSSNKRAFDLASTTLLATMLGVPTALGAAGVVIGERQSALYRSERLGQGWQRFDLLKLTSMQDDAHLLERHWQHDHEDDRITRIGRILRACNINEAPQLINVLQNDMHMVGSRLPNETVLDRFQRADSSLFDEWYAAFPNFKPGLIGPGQFVRRALWRQGKPKRADRAGMKADLKYWNSGASLLTDIKVFAKAPWELSSHLQHHVVAVHKAKRQAAVEREERQVA